MSANTSQEPITTLQVALVAPDITLAEHFAAILCGNESREYRNDKVAIHFVLLVFSSEEKDATEKVLAQVGAAVLLANHLDAKSLGRLCAAAQLLAENFALPATAVLLRESGKKEYKLSCPDCGQKLWVSDNDAGRNGRCPHCKRIFALPAQMDHLKKNLENVSKIPVVAAYESLPDTCRTPLLSLVAGLSTK